MKTYKRNVAFICLIWTILLVLPAIPVKAREAFTSKQLGEMEQDIGNMVIDAPVTKVGTGWRDVLSITVYPSENSGLDSSKPLYYSNMNEYSADDYMYAATWKSSNESVMTVEKVSCYCVVKAVGEGTATVTADIGGKSQSVLFTVSGSYKMPVIEKVEIEPYDSDGNSYKTLKEGSYFSIDSGFYFAGDSNRINNSSVEYRDLFLWKSSNEKVIAANMGSEPGKFLAMSPGTATLTLTVGEASKSVKVKVTNDSEIQWVVPEMTYSEKRDYVQSNGIEVHNEKELFQAIYKSVSKGNYKIALYPSVSYQFDSDLIWKALDLYQEYTYAYNKPVKIDKDTNGAYYSGWKLESVTDKTGRDAEFLTLYNPNAKSIIQKTNSKASAVIKKIVKKGMSQRQKLKAIHDYIVKNCNYDMEIYSSIQYKGKTYYNTKLASYYNGTAYGALIQKKAVCGGYSNAFNLLAHKAGIKTIQITSNKMAHAWNMVKLNGKYQYIDVTWDDPINRFKINVKKPFAPNGTNIPLHKYFLVSAATLNKNHTWDTNKNQTYYKNFYKKYAKYIV